MNVFSFFSALVFAITYAGIFTLRIFHYGFVYERPSAIILECVPTVTISCFLIIVVLLVEHPILKRFDAIIQKGKKDKASITKDDIALCMSCYKKFDIAIAAGEAVGFLLGCGSTAILESIKGIAPFKPAIFIIIELQSMGMGFLCYTIIVFLTKKIFMTQKMREIGIEVSENLSHNLSIAIATCVFISVMNMITVPINLIQHPDKNSFAKFLVYCAIGAAVNIIVCYVTYSVLVKKIQRTEKDISANLFNETQNLAEKSRDAVMSGREALQNNVNELLRIKDNNRLTIEGIKDLNKKISNIWDIVSIINVIADQTKIIAFNAELEASSSGEAGKNFHIVATEIRRLSDNIIDSIKEIKDRINEIQKASDTLILDSEKGTNQIDSGYQSAKSLENDFESIMQSSENTASSSHEILNHVSQLSVSSEQILITLKQIADGVETFSAFTSNISAASENVRLIASRL